MSDLSFHIERALEIYSKDNYFHSLVNAKEEYFNLVGKADEDAESFEQRMNLFNDWYLFIHELSSEKMSPMTHYLSTLEEDKEALSNVVFSVFEYSKNSLRGLPVLKDLIYGKKYTLKKDQAGPGILKGDLFITGVSTSEGLSEMTKGLCILPNSAQSAIKKQCKKVFKLGDSKRNTDLLLELIKMSNKHASYGHLDATAIFKF